MNNAMFIVLLFVKGVFGAGTNSERMLEVTEGDPVFLESCVTKIQRDDKVEWKFESHVIATIEANSPLLYDTENGIFEGKLQINDQTGDLTIRNPRPKHSGLYEVKITSINNAMPCRRFKVTVLDAMPMKVSVTKGESVFLRHNIPDIEIYDVIEWMFEDWTPAIARINKQNSENPSYNENNEDFRGRLKLNQNGSLTITDSRTSDSGLYKLKVRRTNFDGKHRNFRVVVSEPVLSMWVMIVIAVLIVILVVVVGIVCCKCRKSNTVV